MKVISYLILVLGVFCLIYYGVIISYAGIGSSFSWFWLAAGIFSIVLFFIIGYMIKQNIRLHGFLRGLIVLLFISGLSIFIFIEALIIYHGNKKADSNMDYLIVLGAQVRGTRITNSLYHRLNRAATYLKDNPETLVIVSGGQGPGEDISEAEAMKNFLIENGIDEDRILMEDKSTNTNENILYSKKLISKDNAKVALVTNGFHVFRSVSIAKKQGLTNIQGLSAPSDKILTISYYVREIFGVVKYFVFGNM
ncbi:YdcF family protein [Herbinix luporum]|uniref:DUF218 domain-containing protein n=1 Tax=Herbinix luporum TaxID=1679721 RepID=A0A0K8J8W1_9FIRM|nr:YdcF family protein [Herbinix luporum]CUH93693.1 hypothetical protein SD1D_2178 [Herbinix luporum]